MFVLIQILRCGSGRQQEALRRLQWIHGLMAERDDSGGCIVARHLGNPIDLFIMRFWQTKDAMLRRTNAYYQDRWPLFPPNEPEGIYQTQDIAHHFEEVLRTDGAAEGSFIVRTTSMVADDKWGEFLELRRAEDAVMQRSGGLVSSATYRSIENAAAALTVLRFKDRSAFEHLSVDSEKVALEISLSEVTSPLECPDLNVFHTECFEVIDEYAAPAALRITP